MTDPHAITSEAALAALYGETNPMSLTKETDFLTPEYRAWIEAAPFFAIASSGARGPGGGLDCSPRGDAPGQLLRVADARTLLIPDRRGNNRLDTLRNIVADPRVALLFLAPGVTETLRVSGRAEVTADPALLESFAVGDKRPATVIRVSITAVYFQCARALLRARLWESEAQLAKGSLPSAGQMAKAAKADVDAEAYDAALGLRQASTLY